MASHCGAKFHCVKDPQLLETQMSDTICFYSGKRGHWTSNCPEKKNTIFMLHTLRPSKSKSTNSQIINMSTWPLESETLEENKYFSLGKLGVQFF